MEKASLPDRLKQIEIETLEEVLEIVEEGFDFYNNEYFAAFLNAVFRVCEPCEKNLMDRKRLAPGPVSRWKRGLGPKPDARKAMIEFLIKEMKTRLYNLKGPSAV